MAKNSLVVMLFCIGIALVICCSRHEEAPPVYQEPPSIPTERLRDTLDKDSPPVPKTEEEHLTEELSEDEMKLLREQDILGDKELREVEQLEEELRKGK